MGNSSSSSKSEKGRKCRSLPNSPDVRRQLPVPYAKPGINGGTAIPLPATVMVARRCPPDKVRPLPPTPNQQTGLHPGLQKHTLVGSIGSGGAGGGGGGLSAGSGNTPLDGNSCPGSPQHNGTAIITQIPKGGSSLRLPQSTCKIPASPYATQAGNGNHNNNNPNNNNNNNLNNVILVPNGNVTNLPSPAANSGNGGGQQKQSMLEKLKLFNSKDKQDKTAKSTTSKRTSSSSGFSSARSERSDSSLSLNEGPVGKIKESGIKKTDTAKLSSSSSKSSKLISSKSSSKDAGSKVSGKLVDKGKSKDQLETHIPITPKAHKIPTALTTSTNASNPKTESKLKPAPVGGSLSSSSSLSGSRKLDTKSESKTSLLQQQQQQTQPPKTVVAPPSVSTGIPKPMAAVKGTSKPPPQQLQQEFKQKDDIAKLDRALAGFGGLQNGLVSPQHHQHPPPQQNNISNNNSERMTVVNPISVSGNNNVLGSPLHKQHPHQHQIPSCMSDSMHSNSTQGASVGQHSNSSESSGGVIYRPSGSESGSEQLSGLHSPQKSSPSFLFNDVNLNNANNNKFNTVPNKILNTGQQPNGTIYEQEEKQITVVPMRPLLRGYNSHVTLPTRGARGHLFMSEYCEDLGGQGYCSDGDALRKIPARYSDSIENGYLSEGGGGGGAGGGISMLTAAGRQQYISSLRNRTPLPTTIEER
ncbi:protein sickie-like [Topomyia yanbarensis]|uniref:protein sickie-like n=1 Tax=Topomyia yanbarensis TaxID=2498891 RepID=UPI00273B8ABE|nr:protein sickie-like [Topomyia yanbarensis]